MTMEESRRGIENFPVGLRVLAVDDDRTCLKLLETLLRRCQYHVTTTSQAREALDMLRRDKDNYDLVISDVHMPDMNGFRLLELVGLEMDLPVIMLSGNSDPKLVMEGVTHGACDYLVKPIRIEELRNIWQHVFRRKKLSTNSQRKSTDQANAHQVSGDDHRSTLTGNTDQSGKFTRKRKDEEDENEDMGNEYDDPNAQKKARVVWSIDLHRKFVAAVNQLGIQKAVPRRILDLMNVDGLTRENVASHLQKYKLYLRRISTVAAQQANMTAAAHGVLDSPFMRINSFDGLGDSRTPRLANVVLSPYATGGMLGRLNSPSNVNLLNFTSSPVVQTSQALNLTNSINSLGKMHLVLPPSTQNSSLLQGIPPSLELDQLQQNKGPTVSPNFNPSDNSKMFRPAIGSSNPLMNSIRYKPVILHGNAPQAVNGGGFGSHSTRNISSFSSGSFNAGLSGSSNLLDPGKCNENRQNTSSTEPFLASRESKSANGPYIQNHPNSVSSSMALLPSEDSREKPRQSWGEQTQTYAHISRSSAKGVMADLGPSLDLKSRISTQETFVGGRSNGSASTLVQQNENGKVKTESIRRSDEDFLSKHSKLEGGFSAQGYDPLDELMNAVMKRV